MQVQPRSGLIAWPFVRRKTAIQAGYPKSILFSSLCFFKRTEQIEKIQLFFKRHTDRCAETMMPGHDVTTRAVLFNTLVWAAPTDAEGTQTYLGLRKTNYTGVEKD